MSKYLLNKFLFTVDRDPELVERYRSDPRELVTWWEAERANTVLNCHTGEASTWLRFDDVEREALATHDHVEALRAGRAPVPHPDPVHRHVRTGPHRAAGIPEVTTARGWPTSRCPTRTSRRDPRGRAHRLRHSRRRSPSGRTPVPADGAVAVTVEAVPITPLDVLCASGTSYFGAPSTPYVPGVQGVGRLADGTAGLVRHVGRDAPRRRRQHGDHGRGARRRRGGAAGRRDR